MKKKLVFLLALLTSLNSFSQTVTIVNKKFVINDNASCPIYFNGANTPWESWNDFGGTYNQAKWAQNMSDLKAKGINSSRIWFTCNGAGQPTIAADGTCTVSAAFWANCDHLFSQAQANGVYIMATVMSFDHTKPANPNATNWQNMLADSAKTRKFINGFLIPFVNRYKTNPYLWSIDLCNEIEWIYEDGGSRGSANNWGGATYAILQRYVAMASEALHSASVARTDGTKVLITMGSACTKWNGTMMRNGSNGTGWVTNPDGNKWSDAALKAQYNKTNTGLDFYSPHFYGWVNEYYHSMFNKTPADYGIDEKACMAGEMPARDPMITPSMSLTTAFNNLKTGGWQGHMPWTSNITTNLTNEVGSLADFGAAALAFKNNNSALVVPVCATVPSSTLAACKGKYLGNIIAGSVPSTYTSLWNAVTAENGCKWGSVEGTRNVMNWTDADKAYNLAKANNYPFRFHVFAWGSQYPGWITNLTPAEFKAEMEEYMKLASERYPNGIDQIDVVNEALGTHAAGTNYFADGLGGAGTTGFDWIIWCFETARKYFPHSKLILNDYGLENDQNAINQQLVRIKELKKRGLIDGFGSQAHEFNINTLTATQLKSSLDLMATGGVPIYITELDISGDDATQNTRYQTLFPVFWEHASVAGISLWGYEQGKTWKAQTELIRTDGSDRPAMTWLKSYMTARPNSCTSNAAPTVSITAPANNAAYAPGATVTLTATAADAGGRVDKVEFFNGTTLLATVFVSPYTYSWTNVAAGTYTITAKATDNNGTATTASAIAITVAAQQGPYGGTVRNIPGKIEAEDYDLGGQTVAYYDLSTSNAGAAYRTDYVGVETTSDAGGGYNVGWTQAGEWLEYTINVVTAGTYKLDVRVAAITAGKNFHIELDGQNISGTITVPNTGDWQTFQTVSVTTTALTTGQKIMRIVMDAGDFNLNYITTSLITVTGLSPAAVNSSLQCFPNPFNTTFLLKANGAFTYVITDMKGVVVEAGTADGESVVGNTFATGMYLLHFKTEKESKTIKLLKSF